MIASEVDGGMLSESCDKLVSGIGVFDAQGESMVEVTIFSTAKGVSCSIVAIVTAFSSLAFKVDACASVAQAETDGIAEGNDACSPICVSKRDVETPTPWIDIAVDAGNRCNSAFSALLSVLTFSVSPRFSFT